MNLDALAARAGLVLSRRLGEVVALADPVLLKNETRCLVVRCRVSGSGSGAASVIIKQIRDDPARGFSDWASLSFLSDLEGAGGIVPRFLGGDVEGRFFLMEDLGGSRSLGDVLAEDDPEAAASALHALAVQTARLHVAARDGESGFEAIRSALPGAGGLGRRAEAETWLAGGEKWELWFRAAGARLPDGFGTCAENIAEIYADPGPYLSFTHGDPAPSNNHVARNGQVRLLDFEYGGFRHALYDITAWNVLCPLPPRCVEVMNRRSRETLAKSFPAARDDAGYARAWGCLCAFRALAILTWIKPDILQENRPWVSDSWTARHAVLAAVTRLEEAAAGISELAPVREAAGALAGALRRWWPEFRDVVVLSTAWPALKELPTP
uniref:Aminoglycoside phosphotransferase domain-containing protein n=1 Tax=uncultured Armatimonadetes bacterium TaxID=157466 RepID=A0A6J4JQH5_9BACT|nr:hypothetical protein AVDCRST_MAG63-3894 [uncultured Armatimonadetes bacterium]